MLFCFLYQGQSQTLLDLNEKQNCTKLISNRFDDAAFVIMIYLICITGSFVEFVLLNVGYTFCIQQFFSGTLCYEIKKKKKEEKKYPAEYIIHVYNLIIWILMFRLNHGILRGMKKSIGYITIITLDNVCQCEVIACVFAYLKL